MALVSNFQEGRYNYYFKGFIDDLIYFFFYFVLFEQVSCLAYTSVQTMYMQTAQPLWVTLVSVHNKITRCTLMRTAAKRAHCATNTIETLVSTLLDMFNI